MPKITVLVAVFNDEKHLPECLDSLLEQTLCDIQIACVDDGSTDNSGAILDEYASRDKRICVKHFKENQGMSKARNAAINMAESPLITFLDSDDWMSADALEKAVKTFEEHSTTDITLLNFVLCEGNRSHHIDNPYPTKPFNCLSGKEAFEMSLDWSLHGIYVARKELFERFPYDTSCLAYSDENNTRLHYLFANEVRQCDGTYFYRQNPESTTKKTTTRRFLILRANESMKNTLVENNLSEDILQRYEEIRWRNLVDTYMFYYMYGNKLTTEGRKYGRNEMRHAWESIDNQLLPKKLKKKFGYMHTANWTLFWLQEWIYFTLRKLLHKNI